MRTSRADVRRAFDGVTSLQEGSENANTRTVDLSVRFLREIPASISPSTKTLLLSVNALTKLSDSFGHDFYHLRELDLSCNEIEALPPSFGNLTLLRKLKLNNNRLKQLPMSFKFLSSLKVLDLGSNQLETLENDVFGAMLHLEYLNVESNRLNALPCSLGACHSSLTFLCVDNNPLLPPWDGYAMMIMMQSTDGIDEHAFGTIKTLKKRASAGWDRFLGTIKIKSQKAGSVPTTPRRSITPGYGKVQTPSSGISNESADIDVIMSSAQSAKSDAKEKGLRNEHESTSKATLKKFKSANDLKDALKQSKPAYEHDGSKEKSRRKVKKMPALVPLPPTILRDSGYSTDGKTPRPASTLSQASELEIMEAPVRHDRAFTTDNPYFPSHIVSNDRPPTIKRIEWRDRQRQISDPYKAALAILFSDLHDLWDLSLMTELSRTHESKARSFDIEGDHMDHSSDQLDTISPLETAPRPKMLRPAKSSASLRAVVEAAVEEESRIGSAETFENVNASLEQRRKIIKEIIETERTYVRELEALDKLYVKQSQARQGCLSTDEFRLVFGNVTALTMFHRDHFLPELEKSCTDSLDSAPIGHIFAEHSAYIRMYSAYVNNVDTAMSHIEQWKSSKSKKVWRQLCDDARKSPEHRQLHLQGYLLLPVQRIPRYWLLLQSLVKHTPRTHPDYKDLRVGLEEIASRTEEINERKREFEQGTQVIALQQQIRGSETIPLVQPHRRFMYHSVITVHSECRRQLPPSLKRLSRSLGLSVGSALDASVASSYILHRRTVDKPYTFFRFSDVLLQCRQLNDKTYEMIRYVEIPDNLEYEGSGYQVQVLEITDKSLRMAFPDVVLHATLPKGEVERWRR